MPADPVAKTVPLRLRPEHTAPVPETAMVLAAGRGTRMAPLTDEMPKALVQLAGRSLIDHVLDRLAEAGVKRAVVNIHAFADMLEAHLAARSGGPEILVSDERERLLDTGGAIKHASALLGNEPVLVANCDAFWREGLVNPLALLAERWNADEMDALLLIVHSCAALGYDGRGDFLMDPFGRLELRPERIITSYVYAGVQILTPGLVATESDEAFSLRRIWRDLAERGRLFGIVHEGLWAHIGTPESRAALERQLAE